MGAQVAAHDLERDARADGNGVRVHQAAGAVFGVGEDRLEAPSVLLVHRQQDALGNRLRQVGDQVGEVVHLHAVGGGDELVDRPCPR